MNFKRLTLTDIKIDIPRIPKKKSLIAAMEAAGEDIWFHNHLIMSKKYVFCYDLFCDRLNFGCRREEQMGEQLVGKEADCSEEESFLN